MISIRRHAILPFVVAFTATLSMLVAIANADPSPALAVAQSLPTDDAADVFAAGRRSGLLWLAIGLSVTIGLRAVSVRLKPREGGPKPGTWRAKLSLIVGGLAMVLSAAIDMFATSRGLTPILTAAGLAMAAYFGAADDPRRGSKREGEQSGEIVATEGP